MATSLIESLGAYVTPELMERIGSTLGEPSGSVSKGMGAVLPSLLGALSDKAQEPGAFQQVFSLLTDSANDGSVVRDPGSLFGAIGSSGGALAGLAEKLLSLLFGGRLDVVANAVAQYAGVRSASAMSLLKLGAPLVLGVLGDRVRKEGLGASALAALLGSQRNAIQRAIPGALAGLLGSAVAPRAAQPRPAARPAPRVVEPERRSGLHWLLPLAIGLAALAGLSSLLRGGDERRVAERAPELPQVAAPPPAAVVLRRSLPNGVQIAIPQTGFESRVLGFLTDAGQPLDTWFDFDRILFETDSAALEASSREQLANAAEILKAYPSVRVKIGGYTDDRGDAAYNLELSRARAASVRDQLVALGVAAGRLEAEGYGQEHPVATNDTEAGRAQNRRIAMRVTAR